MNYLSSNGFSIPQGTRSAGDRQKRALESAGQFYSQGLDDVSSAMAGNTEALGQTVAMGIQSGKETSERAISAIGAKKAQEKSKPSVMGRIGGLLGGLAGKFITGGLA